MGSSLPLVAKKKTPTMTPTMTVVLIDRQVPVGVFCPLVSGGSNEPFTDKYTRTSDTKVRFMLFQEVFSNTIFQFDKRKRLQG